MKRAAENEILPDVTKCLRIMDLVDEYGANAWTIDKKNPLNKLLGAIPSFEFACQHVLERGDAKEEGITVDGDDCGSLVSPDVPKLLAKANPALFGKGTETVLDPTVRNAYAIEGPRILHRGYPVDLVTLMGKDCANLLYEWIERPAKQIVCRFYKLHIYPTGGHFAVHRDTPHGPNHIATAVVELPTKYRVKGLEDGDEGALYVRHPVTSEEIVIHKAKVGQNELSFAAFYTDCPHRVEKIEEGTRVVLQFDIFVKAAEDVSDESSSEDEDDREEEGEFYFVIPGTELPHATPLLTRQLIEGITEALTAKEKTNVALLLQHNYLSSGLSVDVLKASDKWLWETLQKAGIQLQLNACVLKKEETGHRSHRHDVSAGGLGFKSKYPTILITGRTDSALILLQANEGAEYTGNEPLLAQEIYVAAAIVAIPSEDTGEYE